jgi:hypothetical protein
VGDLNNVHSELFWKVPLALANARWRLLFVFWIIGNPLSRCPLLALKAVADVGLLVLGVFNHLFPKQK